MVLGGGLPFDVESSTLQKYEDLFYFRWNHNCTSTATTASHGMVLGEGLNWKTILEGIGNGLNFNCFKI